MDKLRYNYLIEKKTLWEKKKLFITSNFFFSHNVFNTCLLLMRQSEYLGSKGLTLYQTIPTLNDSLKRKLLKTLREKEKMLVTSISSFSHNVFNPIKGNFQFFRYVYFCRLSAYAFNLDQSGILFWSKELTLLFCNHMIPNFIDSDREGFQNHCVRKG